MEDNFDILTEAVYKIVCPKLNILIVELTEACIFALASAVCTKVGKQIVVAELFKIERKHMAAFIGTVALVAVDTDYKSL